MIKMIVIAFVTCMLVTACSLDKQPTSTTKNPSDAVNENGGAISLANSSASELHALIDEFYRTKQSYPRSVEDCHNYITTSTNEHSINLAAFKVLTFEQGEGDSLTVTWETEEESSNKGCFTVYPKNYSEADTGWKVSSHGSVSGQITNAQPVK